jgi:phosphatidyl-myo-inositol dimannoside synthase
MSKSVLFLTLRVFSATGGIEKVCRIFGKALHDVGANNKVLSLYDRQDAVIEKYIEGKDFRGFDGSKIKFIASALLQATKYDVIVMSHINLLSVGYVIKLLMPRKKLMTFAHGIEVWDDISSTRKRMLNKCDTILAVSNFTKNKLLQITVLPEKKVLVFNNCLDPFLTSPYAGKDTGLMKRYGLEKENMVLLTLTRLSSKELYKGYDHVLYSLKNLKPKFPGIKYLIAGRCDEAEKKKARYRRTKCVPG